jgi:hypothetical protein
MSKSKKRTYPLYRSKGIELDVTMSSTFRPVYALRADVETLSLPELRGFRRYLESLERMHTPEPHWSATAKPYRPPVTSV